LFTRTSKAKLETSQAKLYSNEKIITVVVLKVKTTISLDENKTKRIKSSGYEEIV
jgi:hypothetical protein